MGRCPRLVWNGPLALHQALGGYSFGTCLLTSDACLLSPVPCLPERAYGAVERGLMLDVEGCWAPHNKAASSRRTPDAGAPAKRGAVRVPPLGGMVQDGFSVSYAW